MPQLKLSHKKVAGILALLIALFSIGTVVSVQCHTPQSAHTGSGVHHAEVEAPITSSWQSEIAGELCAGGFALLILFAIRKFVFGRHLGSTKFVSRAQLKLISIVPKIHSYFLPISVFNLGTIRI